MQIILALIFGACWGLIAHFALPGRSSRGAALAPMIGAVVGGLVWLVLTWAGLTVANGWLWVLSIVVPAIVCFAAVPLITRMRSAHDAREGARLGVS